MGCVCLAWRAENPFRRGPVEGRCTGSDWTAFRKVQRTSLSGTPMVVPQHPAESLAALDSSVLPAYFVTRDTRLTPTYVCQREGIEHAQPNLPIDPRPCRG